MMPRIGFCKTCERQTSEDALQCPHCGQQAPFDRYEDLELGQVYQADYKGKATEDLHWFKLRRSGRRVFARIAHLGKEDGEHLLELVSFEGGFPNFRYKTGRGNQS
ncbi:MAG: hypothetical protein WAO95_02805 [Burkholderiales bacterium]